MLHAAPAAAIIILMNKGTYNLKLGNGNASSNFIYYICVVEGAAGMGEGA